MSALRKAVARMSCVGKKFLNRPVVMYTAPSLLVAVHQHAAEICVYETYPDHALWETTHRHVSVFFCLWLSKWHLKDTNLSF
jgi:hypothetical protein